MIESRAHFFARFLRPARIALSIVAILLPIPQANAATGFVTYVIHGESGGVTENVPVTFGAIFAKGDVPPGSSVVATDEKGNALPLQVDIKAKNFDGSLRHAVLTAIVPHLADGDAVKISLQRGPQTQSAPLAQSALPRDFDAVVQLAMKDGRRLRASARDLLGKSASDLWLSGSQVTEWWVSGPLRDASGKADPLMTVRFGIRSYGKGRPVRVEADVENTLVWAHGPRTEFYDAQITANGKTVFERAAMAQPSYTRWRQVFWWDQPVTAYVEQNLDYLKKAHVIPNYAPEEAIPLGEIADAYRTFQASKHAPMEPGIITSYMPTTGGRGDIAPLPEWTAQYLLTMDKRAYDITLATADLGGSFASHLRSPKTGRPATAEEYPTLSTHSNFVGRPNNLEAENTGGYTDPLTPQSAHEPSLDFIPYAVTGDRYYLEELEFWSQWNTWGTAPAYRHGKEGLIVWDELRGEAWSLRTLAQAAFIAPEADPLKQTLLRELHNNLRYYMETYPKRPLSKTFHVIYNYEAGGNRQYPPWQDDYMMWSLGYVVGLGFDFARPFALWKADYTVQRMINKDYCWILATPYQFTLVRPDNTNVATWKEAFDNTLSENLKKGASLPANVSCASHEMAEALGLRDGEMLGGGATRGGYPANLQPALAAAIDLGAPGAQEAWDKFQARPKFDTTFYPQWSIVPWPKK